VYRCAEAAEEAEREQARAPQQEEVQPDARSEPSPGVPVLDVEPQPEPHPEQVQVQEPALLPEGAQVPEEVVPAEPRPGAVVARSRRKPPAARWIPPWQAARQATGSFVSSWPLSFPCLRGVPRVISQLPCHRAQIPRRCPRGKTRLDSPRWAVGTTPQHVERHFGCGPEE
jgi:hypothetical protein